MSQPNCKGHAMKAQAEILVAVGVMALMCSHVVAGTPSLQGLGDLPGEPYDSMAFDVSGDGSTVVGVGNCAPYRGEAFLWMNGVMSGLGYLPGAGLMSWAFGVSADGSVVVGYSTSTDGYGEAFRWENGVMTGLGHLPAWHPSSCAYDVSADGSVVVGVAEGQGLNQAFRWVDGVMTGLGYLYPGNTWSLAYGVSADGSVVVGESFGGPPHEAFRWENGVMSPLGDLPGGSFWSGASAVSADGSVVVGVSTSEDSSALYEAFRWEDGVMTALGGFPSGYEFVASQASDVSADGSVVVGKSLSGPGLGPWRAFVWTEPTGMLKLSDVLVALGVDLGGWELKEATSISDDGLMIVGFGRSVSGDEGWIAALPADWIERVSYELTVSIAKSDWAGWGSVAVEPNLAVYPVGRIVTLTALPNEGIVFRKWKLYDPNHPGDANYTLTDANNPITIAMDADYEVKAFFKCGGPVVHTLPLVLTMLGALALPRSRRD